MQQLDFSDSHDQQVLHYAAAQGQEKLVKELLHRGVGVDTVGGKLRHTPLMLGQFLYITDIIIFKVQV